jgi:hypothetical protein
MNGSHRKTLNCARNQSVLVAAYAVYFHVCCSIGQGTLAVSGVLNVGLKGNSIAEFGMGYLCYASVFL